MGGEVLVLYLRVGKGGGGGGGGGGRRGIGGGRTPFEALEVAARERARVDPVNVIRGGGGGGRLPFGFGYQTDGAVRQGVLAVIRVYEYVHVPALGGGVAPVVQFGRANRDDDAIGVGVGVDVVDERTETQVGTTEREREGQRVGVGVGVGVMG